MSRFLAFNCTTIARKEACVFQNLLVFGIHFDESSGDSKAKCLALTSETATVKVCFYVVFPISFEQQQGLFNYILQNS